ALLFFFEGPKPSGSMFGTSVLCREDLNGDGFADVIIGAPADQSASPGSSDGGVYIYSGRDGSLIRRVGSLRSGDGLGPALARLGDMDGDGVADIAVGASGGWNQSGTQRTGYVLVFSGRTGATIRRIDGPAPDDWFGFAIAALPDVDGDHVRDLAVGAPDLQ